MNLSVYKVKQTWILEGTMTVIECNTTSLDFLFGKDLERKKTQALHINT